MGKNSEASNPCKRENKKGHDKNKGNTQKTQNRSYTYEFSNLLHVFYQVAVH